LAVAAGSAGAAVVLTMLVKRGHLARFDQYSVSHWMPWLEPTPTISGLHGLLTPETRRATWGTVVALSTFPASIVVSGSLILAVVVLLWVRGRRRSSIVLLDIWIAADVIELLGKHLVTRPTLHETTWGYHGVLAGLRDSLPSGHVIRALVLATALAALGRAGRLAYLWALAVPVGVVTIGDHTPTDAAVGLAVGIALVAIYQAGVD
jgi:membrane-associated phospholipid phosphatase